MDAAPVLITGATGFIGRALVRRLVEQGTAVATLVREKTGRAIGGGLPEEAQAYEVDLRYAAGVKRAVEAIAPSTVIHLASVGVTDPFLPLGEALRGNLDATLNVLKAVRGQCRVLVARTSGELDALNPYAASKAAAWQFCRMFQRTEGWPIVGVMPFQVYGPGQPSRTVLGAALQAARAGSKFPMTSGEQKRDWVYIEDVVTGLLATAHAVDIEGQTVELGTGQATSVRDVVTKVFALVGSGQPLIGALAPRPGEVPEQKANAAEAERLTGWRATTGLEAGLQRLIENG
jgi:UDP-glucose 4-epimerase